MILTCPFCYAEIPDPVDKLPEDAVIAQRVVVKLHNRLVACTYLGKNRWAINGYGIYDGVAFNREHFGG